MSEVTIQNLTKRYDGTTAVEDVNLTVTDGETLGVVGPSGCGKTTTLRSIAGFETPSEGAIRFDGTDMTHVPPEDRNVGLVFQSYALFDNMTVQENVEFGPRVRGVGKAERADRAERLLGLLDIPDLADRDPTTLSGGQQQRVGLARALAIEPDILLLDEPMTGLDAKLKRRLRTEIGGLLDDLDVTALYVTHDQAEAMEMCDRLAVMNDGRVEQVGTPEAIYDAPENEFVAEFVGTSNLLDGRIANERIDLGFTTIPAPGRADREDATFALRPEAFDLTADDFAVTVRDRVFLGDHVRVRADLPDSRAVELTCREAPLDAGETVTAGIDPNRVHLLHG